MSRLQFEAGLWFNGGLCLFGLLGLALGLALGFGLEWWAARRTDRDPVPIEMSKFAPEMQKLVAAFEEFGRKIGDLMLPPLRRFAEALSRAFESWEARLLRVYAAHGPRNVTGDGEWQSDCCAGWVHDACPAPVLCDCTCHGGTLR